MAARTGRLLQNQNLNVHLNGTGTVSGKADLTGQKKDRVGGRKPLGDLSNAGKPINQFDGKKALDGSLNPGKPFAGQAPEGDKRIVSKTSEKTLTGSRKALSDISNSRKPHVHETKSKKTQKLSSLTEEPLLPSAIAEEQMLHDHRKCIKSQFETDVHQFFKTVGLQDDSDDHMTISFELSSISELKKSESPYMELEELLPEQLPELQSRSALYGSPVSHCKTPSLSSYSMWNDSPVNFKLIESPKLTKN